MTFKSIRHFVIEIIQCTSEINTLKPINLLFFLLSSYQVMIMGGGGGRGERAEGRGGERTGLTDVKV